MSDDSERLAQIPETGLEAGVSGGENFTRDNGSVGTAASIDISTTVRDSNGSNKRAFTMEELFSTSTDQSFSKLAGSASQVSSDDLRLIYLYEYGKGMNLFFETNWYTEKGWDHLLQDIKTFEEFSGMLELFASTKVNDYETFLKLPQIEARVTWSLLCMPRVAYMKVRSQDSDAGGTRVGAGLDTILRKLIVFEYLITNRCLPENPLAGLSQGPGASDSRQFNFWHELAHFAAIPQNTTDECWDSLAQLRQLLDGLESRDVLYSIAIMRCEAVSSTSLLVNRNGTSQSHLDAIAVAKKFIEDEASSKGTTQVIQRLCGMAVRSWIAMH